MRPDTGGAVTALRALEMGMVHQVVPAAEIESTTMALARTIAGHAPLSLTGIKAGLLRAVDGAQRAHGATGLLTWVIAGNKGARAFYEALGGALVVEQPFQWDGMDLVEAGYGWRDLPGLAAACAVAESYTQ